MPNTGKQLTTPIITVLAVFISLFVFFKLFGPIPFFIQNVTTSKQSFFTVAGTGEVAVIPDTAMISLGVTKTAPRVNEAQEQVNVIINDITQNMKLLGVEDKDIKTTSYNINPQYDYKTTPARITEYQVSTNIQVKLKPIEKANQAIDEATKSGANQVDSIYFTIDDEMQKKLQSEAREKAINEAKEKAKSLADAAGIKLGRIVDITENSGYSPAPFMKRQETGLSMEKVEDTNLNPGENIITASVTLSYETY
jgi:hypothetical protein